jgi:molybdate transport system substrate-binding protein
VTRPRASRALAALVCAALIGAGCGDDESSDSEREGTITVSAATSLTDAFTRIGDDFTAAHPGVEVTFNFDSSSTLSAQILEGAPADVFASADEANMIKLTDESRIDGEPEVFARSELVIVTKPGNPEGITGLADLADVGVVALCGADVPCGKYAQQALDAAGVVIPETNVTRGQNARATLTAVAEGDALAGIVYVTDAASAGEAVATVAIPAEQNAIATYPIAVLADASDAELAAAFVAYVLGDDGQAVLEEFGFLSPA